MNPQGLKTAVVIFAALAAFAPGRAAEPGDDALSITGAGRIAVSLDGSGYLHEIESGRLRLGLRWPGVGGTEFLGSGGLLLRFISGEDGGAVLLGPGDFETALPGPCVAGATEGCRGGKRYPADGCDDDGDGAIDEDPLDGRDNDGDGAIDEDFAAVGDGMYVTSSLASRYGIKVTHAHHVWNYGHVRDFIGVTTTIEYLPPEGEDEILREFELIHYIDFEIGDRDDAGRGRNDRAFFIQALPGEEKKILHAVAAVSDAGNEGPLATVMFFSASRPNGPMTAGVRVHNRHRHVDSLWNGDDEGCRVLGGEPAMLDIEEAELLGGIRGQDIMIAEAATGDIVLTHRFCPAGDICPGERVELEWVIVFGKD
ncbi:MAG: hypothetical protein KAU49_06670, partial [Candidatus Krumholzibacteria bacterium]|nr:hypothetical protein [Candidatus Krumholzibacteria bacterium]